MKVNELAAQLSDLDPNAEVIVMRRNRDGDEIQSKITGMMTYRGSGGPIAELWVDLL